MARLSNDFQFGENDSIDLEHLLVSLKRMYFELATAINSKPDLYQRTTDGSATDVLLSQGSININLSSNKVEMLTNHTSPTNVTWTTLS